MRLKTAGTFESWIYSQNELSLRLYLTDMVDLFNLSALILCRRVIKHCCICSFTGSLFLTISQLYGSLNIKYIPVCIKSTCMTSLPSANKAICWLLQSVHHCSLLQCYNWMLLGATLQYLWSPGIVCDFPLGPASQPDSISWHVLSYHFFNRVYCIMG